MNDGWIKLYRRIQEHRLYPTRRRFTNFEAWIALLMAASHQNHMVELGTTQMVEVKRGQVLTSQSALAARWKWTRETVSHYLKYLLKYGEIADIETSKQTATGYTLITIRNYSKYQNRQIDDSDIQTSSQSDNQSDIKPTSSRHTQEWKEGKEYILAANSHFERAWKLYPKRAGGNSKKNALAKWSARIRAGVDPAEMLAGVDRYAKYIRATGKEASQYVKQAEVFFGSGEHWKESWEIPQEQRPNGGFVG